MLCPGVPSLKTREGIKILCENVAPGWSDIARIAIRQTPQISNFASECGHSLAGPSKPFPNELSFDEKLNKIQKYLPKGLTEKILAQRDRIEGERKQVTVDVLRYGGIYLFSGTARRPKPHTVSWIGFMKLLINKVHDYEGTVNELTW